jgi:hypothetical protein
VDTHTHTQTQTPFTSYSRSRSRPSKIARLIKQTNELQQVGLDEDHTVISWDWQKGTKLASARGHRDQIFCIKWRPLVKNAAVTVGVRHIKFWEQAGSGFTSKRGVFGKVGKLDTMLCVEFGANGEVYTGSQGGLVCVLPFVFFCTICCAPFGACCMRKEGGRGSCINCILLSTSAMHANRTGGGHMSALH